jgi:hypothetical protein
VDQILGQGLQHQGRDLDIAGQHRVPVIALGIEAGGQGQRFLGHDARRRRKGGAHLAHLLDYRQLGQRRGRRGDEKARQSQGAPQGGGGQRDARTLAQLDESRLRQ